MEGGGASFGGSSRGPDGFGVTIFAATGGSGGGAALRLGRRDEGTGSSHSSFTSMPGSDTRGSGGGSLRPFAAGFGTGVRSISTHDARTSIVPLRASSGTCLGRFVAIVRA